MPLPALVKTWQFNHNKLFFTSGDQLTDNREFLRWVKNTMVGFNGNYLGAAWSSPWEVRGSSSGAGSFVACPANPADPVTQGSLGVYGPADLWQANGNLIWNEAANHSWIVLRQPGIQPRYEVLFELGQNNAGYTGSLMDVYVSCVGFTGGNATTRPTATDEYWWRRSTGAEIVGEEFNSSRYRMEQGPLVNTVVHVLQSTDGTQFHLFLMQSGVPRAYWNFTRPANVHPSWANPNQATMVVRTTLAQAPIYGYVHEGARSLSLVGTTPCANYYTGEALISALIGEYFGPPQDLDFKYPILPIGIHGESTGVRSRLGTFTDIFWGAANVQDGETYPTNLTRQFIQMGDLVVPWNGVIPVLTL